jgi:antitoxin Xre/MbcA/ParS-like protein
LALPQPTYPVTRYEPAPFIDLSLKPERDRLSASALKGFFNLVDRWRIRDEDARGLLGGLSNGPYYTWKKQQPQRALGEDVLLRISYLIGIFKALNILYGEKLADEWVRLPNTNRIFGGRTPLEYMLRGGVPAMQVVRRLLDARRGGM